jgi:2-methylcitrate dehydratase
VQRLLQRVIVRPNEEFSHRFPDAMPCRLTIKLKDGRILMKDKNDYEGFITHPMSWEYVSLKFEALSETHLTMEQRREIISTVSNLEKTPITDLMRLLSHAHPD